MRPAAVLALCAALAACSAPAEVSDDRPQVTVSSGDPSDPREQERNLDALHELLDRAREVDASEVEAMNADSDGMPVGLPVEVLGPPADPALTDDGALRRRHVDAFVEQGPHALLGVVTFEPARNASGDMLGFRIVSISDDGAFVTDGGLQSGDVVRSVNGRSIVMPDVFIEVFEGLTDADALTVEVQRGETPITFSWPIVDAE